MASKSQLADLDFNNAGKIINLSDPTNPQDAATKAYADSLVGGVAVTTVEIDIGATPVKNKAVVVTDATIIPTSKIIAKQAGRAATGRPADENDWTRLDLVASPGTGDFTLWVRCLTGKMRGKFLVDYIKG